MRSGTFAERLLTNHPLVNILFTVVLVMGALSYFSMPREQDPEINFNWVNINTSLPGASAEDVEAKETRTSWCASATCPNASSTSA